ncbi:MAG: MBL fold metallo-hydrolase [Actinobacteria bacterium]|nr:MBL fold metallo-hydrolase [Actinomycetota bacterium]
MTTSDTPGGWSEVADRCFVRRHEHLDVSSTAIIGAHGVTVVDTRASRSQGHDLVEQVRRLTSLPVAYLVNTHVHFDHLFGNGAFAGVPAVAHDSVPADLPAHVESVRRLYEADTDDPYRHEVLATEVVPPDVTFSSAWATDLGDRYLEVVHLGRGHTAGDVLVRVPDADLLCAGDLIESSAAPSYGVDCYPLEWGATLEQVSSLIGAGTVVVPGHGPVVDKAFVLDQRLDIVDVSEQIRALAHARVPVGEALAQGQWPFPADGLRDAVRRGYAHGDRES